MYHTLRTLYDYVEQNNKAVLDEFYARHPESLLKEYCYDADEMEHKVDLNRGFNSLKWAIYVLRDLINENELVYLFNELILFATVLGEDKLYNDVLSLIKNENYKTLLLNTKIDVSNLRIINHNDLRIIINDTDQNLTSYIFKHNIADVIVFYNKENKWAGVVVDQKRDIHKKINMAKLFWELAQRNEPWAVIGVNLIMCGGKKHPNKKTNISLDELIALVKKYYI